MKPKEDPVTEHPNTDRRATALDLAEEAAARVLILVASSDRIPGCLKDQLRRSASSVALNLAESDGTRGKARANSRRIAYGEAKETTTNLKILHRAASVDWHEISEILDLLDRTRAMIWRLLEAG